MPYSTKPHQINYFPMQTTTSQIHLPRPVQHRNFHELTLFRPLFSLINPKVQVFHLLMSKYLIERSNSLAIFYLDHDEDLLYRFDWRMENETNTDFDLREGLDGWISRLDRCY